MLSVCSQDPDPGEMHDIMTVLESPTNESLSTSVSLLPLKGIWPWSLSSALMHSFKASKLLFISAPSILEIHTMLSDHILTIILYCTIQTVGNRNKTPDDNNHAHLKL